MTILYKISVEPCPAFLKGLQPFATTWMNQETFLLSEMRQMSISLWDVREKKQPTSLRGREKEKWGEVGHGVQIYT